MSKKKIINYFFKQAETGNWEKIKYSDVEKKLNLKKNSIKKKKLIIILMENTKI